MIEDKNQLLSLSEQIKSRIRVYTAYSMISQTEIYGAMTNLMDNEIQNIPYRIVKRKIVNAVYYWNRI